MERSFHEHQMFAILLVQAMFVILLTTWWFYLRLAWKKKTVIWLVTYIVSIQLFFICNYLHDIIIIFIVFFVDNLFIFLYQRWEIIIVIFTNVLFISITLVYVVKSCFWLVYGRGKWWSLSSSLVLHGCCCFWFSLFSCAVLITHIYMHIHESRTVLFQHVKNTNSNLLHYHHYIIQQVCAHM